MQYPHVFHSLNQFVIYTQGSHNYTGVTKLFGTLKVYRFLSYDRFFWIICETHEEIAVTVIQVISIAIFYWHCKFFWNLRLIFGVNMIY